MRFAAIDVFVLRGFGDEIVHVTSDKEEARHWDREDRAHRVDRRRVVVRVDDETVTIP